MRIGKVLAFLVVLLFAWTSAMAGGFRLPEAGAKAMSMGFAFTAQANDPSAIYFNPAGIMQLEGNNLKVGVTYVKQNGGTFTGAWKVNDVLSVAAGIDFMYGKAELAKPPVGINSATGFPANIFNLDLEGDGTAWGYNFGVLLTPTKHLKVGAAYRSKFDLEIEDGDVDLSNVFSGNIITALGPLPPQGPAPIGFGGPSFHTTGTAMVRIPATLDLGVAYILDRLTLEVDASWTFWHSWESLNIDLKDNRTFLPDSTSPKNWDDVVAIYVGGEYRVTDPLALRLGFR